MATPSIRRIWSATVKVKPNAFRCDAYLGGTGVDGDAKVGSATANEEIADADVGEEDVGGAEPLPGFHAERHAHWCLLTGIYAASLRRPPSSSHGHAAIRSNIVVFGVVNVEILVLVTRALLCFLILNLMATQFEQTSKSGRGVGLPVYPIIFPLAPG